MRFPPYLFGFKMTTELWYILVFIGALVSLWLLTKIFEKLSEDIVGGIVVFALIIIFFILVLNLVDRGSSVGSLFDQFINGIFR